jgi:hypothetical protein
MLIFRSIIHSFKYIIGVSYSQEFPIYDPRVLFNKYSDLCCYFVGGLLLLSLAVILWTETIFNVSSFQSMCDCFHDWAIASWTPKGYSRPPVGLGSFHPSQIYFLHHAKKKVANHSAWTPRGITKRRTRIFGVGISIPLQCIQTPGIEATSVRCSYDLDTCQSS